MRKLKHSLFVCFSILLLTFGIKAVADFSHLGIAPNLTPCFPYIYDTGPEIVQIVGIVNRSCLYRVIKTKETVDCKFSHAQLTQMLNEIKSKPKFVFNTLDTLNTFQKFQVTKGVCEIKENRDNSFEKNDGGDFLNNLMETPEKTYQMPPLPEQNMASPSFPQQPQGQTPPQPQVQQQSGPN